MLMNDLLNLFLLGITYGATVCSFSCLPYLGPYLISSGTGFRDGMVSSCAFASGKLCMYSALGGSAALLGRTMIITPAHKIVMGAVLVAIALTIPFVSKDGCQKRTQIIGKRFSLFIAGIVSSFIPCPPLAAVFILAMQQERMITGMMFGLFYGLGLVASPMLLAGGGLALVSHTVRQKAKSFIPYMQWLSMIIIFITAVKVML